MGVLKSQVAMEYQYPSFLILKKSGTVLIVPNYDDFLNKLDTVLQRLHAANLIVNIEKKQTVFRAKALLARLKIYRKFLN